MTIAISVWEFSGCFAGVGLGSFRLLPPHTTHVRLVHLF